MRYPNGSDVLNRNHRTEWEHPLSRLMHQGCVQAARHRFSALPCARESPMCGSGFSHHLEGGQQWQRR